MSRNEESKTSTEPQFVSALTKVMFRTATEQNLLTARNHIDDKLELKNELRQKDKPKSKILNYQRRSNKSTNPTSRGIKNSKSNTNLFSKNTVLPSYKAETEEIKIENEKLSAKAEANKNIINTIKYASSLGPPESGKVLICKWVDYSSKYGIGYKLSNGCYGVLYNDSTKMILNQNSFDFMYVRREASSQKESLRSLTEHYTFAEYPVSHI